MAQIYYKAEEVWEMYLDQFLKAESGEETLLAENTETGVGIYFLFDKSEPAIVVIMDNESPVYEVIYDEEQCYEVVQEAYDFWLTANVNDFLEDDETKEVDDEDELFDEECIINEREDYLDIMVNDFITEVTDCMIRDADYPEIVQDCKEHFLAYMYRKHGLIPYRPMMLVDDDNKEHFEEYPYEFLYPEEDIK